MFILMIDLVASVRWYIFGRHADADAMRAVDSARAVLAASILVLSGSVT
jgi:hypothetical protein